MVYSISEKIIKEHLLEGSMEPGEQVTIKLDQCLLQDATGTMAWLEYEAIGVAKVKTKVTQYIDHNMLQEDNKNMDDHLFLMSIASKHGAKLSLPGNGISHHVHKERFTIPGETLIGSDSHTPTAAGSGMLAIGVGGMEVASGMATGSFTFAMPEIVGVKLTGKLKPWSTAKDVILELLKREDVDGGKGKIYEYFGDGVKTLDVSERSTIGNMGAETGATTTMFPSDDKTKEFFVAQGRAGDFKILKVDKDYEYNNVIEINLDQVEPLIACPHSPGKVKAVRDVQGIEIGQAMIGSSTNSSYEEMTRCAHMVDKMPRNMRVAYHVIPGSRQVIEQMAHDGELIKLIKGGARISEPGCNACIGMGNAPAHGIVSVRSFPRNWEGRTGTQDDQVFLSSPETSTACAIKGEITDPRDLGLSFPKIKSPTKYIIDDSMVLNPTFKNDVKRGPNIKKLSYKTTIDDKLQGKVIIKLGDDVSTDHILPAGAKILPLRSNIPAISEFVFCNVDKDFVKRCKELNGGFIVGGNNYGQGSSREHAAIAPMYLGIKAVIARAFARIHRSNLINFGIVPLEFESKKEYNKIKQNDDIVIKNVHEAVKGDGEIEVTAGGKNIGVKLILSDRERQILIKGGLLNFIKGKV